MKHSNNVLQNKLLLTDDTAWDGDGTQGYSGWQQFCTYQLINDQVLSELGTRVCSGPSPWVMKATLLIYSEEHWSALNSGYLVLGRAAILTAGL